MVPRPLSVVDERLRPPWDGGDCCMAIRRALACTVVLTIVAPAHAGELCPPSLPDAGSSCSPVSDAGYYTLRCEYGGNAFAWCTTVATCTPSGFWAVELWDAGCSKDPECPPTFGAPDAAALPVWRQLVCTYPEGTCSATQLCMNEDGSYSYAWVCRAWTDVPPGCPVPRPLFGTTSCPDAALFGCDYSGCCGTPAIGYSEECVQGVWMFEPENCSCPPPPITGDPACPGGALINWPFDGGIDAPSNQEDDTLVSAGGCGCDLPSSASTPGAAVLAIALAWLRRRRRGSSAR